MPEEYGNTSNIILDGTKRSQLLFGKHSVTHNLYKNINSINSVDANEGALYQKWLMNTKIPELKQEIEDALVDELTKTGDMDLLFNYVDEFNKKLDKFRELCNKSYNELDYLRSYV